MKIQPKNPKVDFVSPVFAIFKAELFLKDMIFSRNKKHIERVDFLRLECS
jgi:hypothetical protein